MRFPTMLYVQPSNASDQPAHKMRLDRLVWVYTCQNDTLLEITCRSSIVSFYILLLYVTLRDTFFLDIIDLFAYYF